MSEISHTSIVLALKNELLNSLLTFSSGKVLPCQQTHIWVGLPVQSLRSKDDNVLAALQMAEENPDITLVGVTLYFDTENFAN